jgi:hypothetical protein
VRRPRGHRGISRLTGYFRHERSGQLGELHRAGC